MDFLHDILALPGSVGLGLAQAKDNNGFISSTDGTQSGLLDPLRRLLQDRFEPLSNAYNNSSHTLPDGTSDGAQGQDIRVQALRARLDQAQTYSEWLSCATELDQLGNKDAWKLEEESAEYDTVVVKSRLDQMDETRLSRDEGRILLLIRTALTRNLGGMGDMRLYKHSRVGTKALIERYIDSALSTIETLVDLSTTGKGTLDTQKALSELVFARQAFGRSALLLSGGGTFGMNHIGVIKTLYETGLLPRIISGASAGSIVAAVLCTKMDVEIPQVLKDFCYGDLAVFEEEGKETGILHKAFRFMTKGSLFDISHLVRVMKDLLGDMTFQEAYNRTRRILSICVSPAGLYELPRLLNYVTAPNVMIWSAVAASCSVPLIFSAAQLFAKDPKTGDQVPWNQSPQRWIDGSVDNDLPMTRLSEMFNVNHFIVSQVNPHVVPFLAKNEDDVAAEAQRSNASVAPGPGFVQTMTHLAKSEALHRLQVLTEMGFMPTAMSKVRSVLGQKYSGDITIFPHISYSNFPRVLSNPTTDFMVQAMLSGERATWPKLSEIRNHCAIELALDNAVHQMMTRVAFSPSQVDLRRMTGFDQTVLASGGNRGRKGRGRRASPKMHRNSVPAPRTSIRSFPQGKRAVWFGSEIPPPDDPPCLKIAGPGSEEISTEESIHPSDDETEYDESDEGFTSDSSEESPPSPRPSLWPSTRQLFPHASQPATPSIASKHFDASPGANSGLNMTSAAPSPSRPSSPELRYKRLFHSVKMNAMNTIHSPENGLMGMSADGSSEVLPVRRTSNSALDIDISGTKGMMRRRKRSLSTGLKGLWPSGKR